MNVRALVHRMTELVNDLGEGPPPLSSTARRAADEEAHFRRLETALRSLARARERLAQSRRSGDGKPAKTRRRAGELAGHAEELDRRFRQCLTLLKVHGAVVWWRVRRPVGEEDEDDGAQGNLPLSYLDATMRFIEDLNEIEDQTFEGRSRDGRITVRVDSRGHLVDSDLGTVALGDTALKAGLIEAVNAAIEPVRLIRNPMKLFAEAEGMAAWPAAAEVDDGRDEVPWEVVDEALEGLEILLDARETLERVGADRTSDAAATTAATLDETIPRFAEAEGLLSGALPRLAECFSFLMGKIGRPEVNETDLDLLAELEDLFFEDGFDELWGVGESDAHIADVLMMGVTSGLEEKRKRIADAHHWRAIHDRQQSRVDDVEARTFEARSDDGTVVARTDGRPRLVDLAFDAECVGDRGSLAAAVVGAVNSALDKSERERARAMFITPVG